MRTLLAICLVIPFLAGCARITYRYDGQAYRSAEQALKAHQVSNDTLVAQIQPARNRVGGTLNFHVPDKNAILERGIRKTGEPRAEILDYVAESSSLTHRGLYDALVKRGSFDRVQLNFSGGEHVPSKPGEYVVYLFQPNAQTAAWFFSSDAVKREQLHFDTSKTDRAERIQYWLASIEALAKIK